MYEVVSISPHRRGKITRKQAKKFTDLFCDLI